MHSKYAKVPQEMVDAALACKARSNRVVAVATTSVRSLKSAVTAVGENTRAPFFGDTRIFIYPGYHFRVIDALITNFHLPESTFIMLVSAFAGYRHTLATYWRSGGAGVPFFSYKNAMFITRSPTAAQARVGES